MAIWFAQDSKTNNCQAELRADDATDVTDLADFATEHNLQEGSTCLILGTSEVYGMKSDGSWVSL